MKEEAMGTDSKLSLALSVLGDLLDIIQLET